MPACSRRRFGLASFMPGVLLAIREVMERDHLVEGLDQLVGLT